MPPLSAHPIFRINDGPAAPNTQNIRRNTVAFKGTEVYVAVGSTVRYAELREWFAMDSESQDKTYYQTLKLSNVNFTIQELVWNQYGTHLALVGEHDVAVVSFPRLGLTSLLKAEIIHPKIIPIGKAIYGAINTIRKVSFHPHSKHDNTLIILSSDSHLRVFELSLSPHIPEQDIPLFPTTKRGYTVDFDIPVPISFAFCNGDAWLSWTILILTRDGDIYLLTPIMPTKCVLSRAAVTRMKAIISFRAEQARQTECSVAERETVLNQARWISDILGQISMGEFMGVTSSPAFTGNDTFNNNNLVTFKRPNKVRPTPQLQGPVLWQPAPSVMDDILPQANDLAFINAEGVGIIVVTFAGGRVDIGVLVDKVEGVWSVKGVAREEFPSIRVAAYENVDVPIQKGMWTGVLSGNDEGEGVFVAAGGRVWQLDFRAWLVELQKLEEVNEDEEPFEQKRSTLKLITNESPDVIIGYGLLFDPLLDYHLLTITSTYQSKFTELSLPTILSLSPTTRSPSPTQSRRTTKPATYLAYPFPDLAPLTSPGKRVLQGLRIPRNILREKDPISMDAIKVLGDITVRIRNIVNSVLQVGEGLRGRLELQQKELTAHLSKLTSTHTSILTLSSTLESHTTKLQTINETQKDLESRANILLRELLTISQPQTSEAEEKWFRELARVKTRLEGQRGLVTEVRTRLAEGRKVVELAGRRGENGQGEGTTSGASVKKVDGRVMEAIEEAGRKIEKLKIRTARLGNAV